MRRCDYQCYVCQICNQHHCSWEAAAECEARGIPEPIPVGTIITLGHLLIEIDSFSIDGHNVNYNCWEIEKDGFKTPAHFTNLQNNQK